MFVKVNWQFQCRMQDLNWGGGVDFVIFNHVLALFLLKLGLKSIASGKEERKVSVCGIKINVPSANDVGARDDVQILHCTSVNQFSSRISHGQSHHDHRTVDIRTHFSQHEIHCHIMPIPFGVLG